MKLLLLMHPEDTSVDGDYFDLQRYNLPADTTVRTKQDERITPAHPLMVVSE